jgi:hypothetical protein
VFVNSFFGQKGNDGNLTPFTGTTVFDAANSVAAVFSPLFGCYKLSPLPALLLKYVHASRFGCFSASAKVASIALPSSTADVYFRSLFVPGHGGYNLTQTVDTLTCQLISNDVIVVNGNGPIHPVSFAKQLLWNVTSGLGPLGATIFDVPDNCKSVNATAFGALVPLLPFF